MLAKLRARLRALSHSLGIQEGLRKITTRKMNARHAGQKKAERQAEKARDKADELRREAHAPGVDAARAELKLRKADRKDRKAERLTRKAEKEKGRAVFWRGRTRILAKRIAGIETNIDEVQREIRQLSVTIEGNVAKGGTDLERWLAVQNASVANCATGKRRNFYDMSGAWNVDHPIVPGEAYGERSDCSQTVTAWAKAAGLPDPNGTDYTGGYTGTLQQGHNGWRQVSFAHMVKAKRPAFFIYGGGVGHHTEGWCPVVNENGAIVSANRSAGHGSAPVDYGVPDLFGDSDFRCFIYDPE